MFLLSLVSDRKATITQKEKVVFGQTKLKRDIRFLGSILWFRVYIFRGYKT